MKKIKKYLTIQNLYILIISTILFVSCFVRLYHYLQIRSLWHDETSLAYNILTRNFLQLLLPLNFYQSAPPIFLWLAKFSTSFSNIPIELSLRFIPFIFSIISIFVFYKLSTKIFTNKFAIILSNFLFCINFQLIYYAQEFKQYSTDVLIIILLILYLHKLDISKLTKKQNLILLTVLSICPLISLASLFAIAGYITYWILSKNFKNIKHFFCFIAPIVFVLSIYYFTILLPSQKIMLSFFQEYWNKGFLDISNLKLIRTNLQFLFSQNNYWYFILIPVCMGIFLGIKNKINIVHQIILIFFFVGVASILHIYPTKDRMILYTIPLVIILSLMPLNYISKSKKLYATIVITLTLISFSQYNFNYFKNLTNQTLFEREYSREFMQILVKNAKPTDIIIYNNGSVQEFAVYSQIYQFKPLRYGEIRNTKLLGVKDINLREKIYFEHLNRFPKNNYYWFYYSHDYIHNPTVNLLKKWNKLYGQTIIEKEKYGSYLLYTYVK